MPSTRRGTLFELGQPHRLGQPAGGVDGEYDHPAASFGGPEPERGGGGCLADAAGAAAHDDLHGRIVQEGVDRQAA